MSSVDTQSIEIQKSKKCKLSDFMLFPTGQGFINNGRDIILKLYEKVFRRSLAATLQALYVRLMKLSLKTKIMLFTVIMVSGISVILVSFFLISMKRHQEYELEKWGLTLASNLASSVQYATQLQDINTLQNYLRGFMNQSTIKYAAILDQNGAILAKIDDAWLFKPDVQMFSIHQTEYNDIIPIDNSVYYNIVKPITIKSKEHLTDEQILFNKLENQHPRIDNHNDASKGEEDSYLLGVVVLGISTTDMYQKIGDMRNLSVFIALIFIVVCTIIIYCFVGRFLKPIHHLVDAAGKVAHGNLNCPVENDRFDELGKLANAFNEMTLKLKRSQEQIKEYTLDLENQITIRTGELRESEKKYRTLFEHAGNALTVISHDYTLLMMNKGFEELSGYQKHALEGKFNFLNFFQWEHQQVIREAIQRSKNLEFAVQPLNCDCIFTDHYKNIKNVNLTISLIPGTKYFLTSISDVTKIRELHKKLHRSEQLATIGKLSASIAHEIRNPLGAINTSVGILKDSLILDEQDNELMRIISEESQRLNSIICEFLQFARPNSPNFENTDINSLIKKSLLLYRNKFGNSIAIDCQFDETLPEIKVDPDQIKQVMINIILNAIDSMPNGGSLAITSKLSDHIRLGNRYIEIDFSDSGVGINEYDLKKIFQPFYSTKDQGTGMGLAICDRIIQNHNGEIKVLPRKPNGTTFSIFLPLKQIKKND
ncbi:HAMP domain-containing protein [candidate division KSB1 bacterium]|nr:HAMP domain-containing protein [candidate division KSB1 bacterium]